MLNSDEAYKKNYQFDGSHILCKSKTVELEVMYVKH